MLHLHSAAGKAHTAKSIDAMKRVAEKRLKELSSDRRFIARTADEILREGAHLADVVRQHMGSGTEVKDHNEALNALFEPAALEHILKLCKNAYWFWYLVNNIQTNFLPVNVLAVARAHARVKDLIKDRRYGFDWVDHSILPHELKGYPPGFVLTIWEKGLILCEGWHYDEYRVHLNPLLIED